MLDTSSLRKWSFDSIFIWCFYFAKNEKSRITGTSKEKTKRLGWKIFFISLHISTAKDKVLLAEDNISVSNVVVYS